MTMMVFESARFSYEIHENLVELVVRFGSVHGSLTLKKILWTNPQDARVCFGPAGCAGFIFDFSSRQCVADTEDKTNKEEAELRNSM